MVHFPVAYSIAGPVSQRSIEAFGDRVPLDLARAWKDEGQLMTADGFVRAIDPEPLMPVMQTIFPVIPGGIPLFATAWGDLLVMDPENRHLKLVLFRFGFYNDYLRIPDLAFDELTFPEGQRTTLQRDFYDQSVSTLGVPGIDECFGFVLPLSLGGARDLSNVARRPLKEHLVFLVQSGGVPRHLDEVSPPRPRPASRHAPSEMVERGKALLNKIAPNATYEARALPEDRAVHVWQSGFGGSQILVGEDGTILFGNSSLDLDAMLNAWRSGTRTPIEEFESPS